ncbi:MAG: S41 family peptidase [Saprospiraceae bacterium]|nr:S41 family peptidase [Saprospiraceae bacterium]
MKNLLFLLLLATCLGCQKEIFEPEPATDAPAVFDYTLETFRSWYAPTEERNIDWDFLQQAYAPLLTKESTDDELFTVLTDLLANLDDTHVSITAPGKELFFANKYYRERTDDALFDTAIIETNYLLPGFTKGPDEADYTYGLLRPDIGYLWLGHVGANWTKLEAAMKQADLKGFVLDLRHNEGGDFTFALQALQKLNPTQKTVFRSRTKNGPKPDDFTDWYTWHLEGGGTSSNHPIVVLTDRYTVSACERAVMALRQMDGVTIIGDTTNGSVSTTVARQLPNGWGYRVATQDVEAPDGNIYEGKGIPPDVFIQNSITDIAAGKDKVLEQAIMLLQ